MADSPEIPEATNPFEKRVALSIAILAICLSFIGNLGDNAKTDAIIKTNEASNQWGYFQAKSIKGQMSALHGELLMRLAGDAAEAARLQKEAARYEEEKSAIKTEAETLQKAAAHKGAVNDRCDQSALLLQIGVVICSIAILAHSRNFWWVGVLLGAAGAVVGATAFLL